LTFKLDRALSVWHLIADSVLVQQLLAVFDSFRKSLIGREIFRKECEESGVAYFLSSRFTRWMFDGDMLRR